MNERECRMIEEAIAKVIAEERRRTRFEFDRELAVLREGIAAARVQISVLERDLANERRLAALEYRAGLEERGAGVTADHGTLAGVEFLHRRRQ